ncbi:MAG: hypothetical protein HZA53_03980, partial [Planctomycetes bacterium]|nr:hypothetical protein [Planctomycetota bacterium]
MTLPRFLRASNVLPLSLFALAACGANAPGGERVDAPRGAASTPPLPTVKNVDVLIEKDERHFAHLWRLTKDVDNAAEGYWSFDGRALVMQ